MIHSIHYKEVNNNSIRMFGAPLVPARQVISNSGEREPSTVNASRETQRVRDAEN